MKSILQEANSIERAIDKAWNEAGKPREFTIKVLDEGERNFLGLSRRPAIVSIVFKPEKVTNPLQQPRKDEQTKEVERRERRDKERSDKERGHRERLNHQQSRETHNRSDADTSRTRRYAGTDEQRAAFHKTQAEGWSSEWQDFVMNELRELLSRMGMSTEMDGAVTADKVFTVSFKKALLDNDDEQRMLFATFSYLAIQLLKRQYKSRFVGYRIAVTGPKADGSAMSADSDEQGSAPAVQSAPRTPRQPRENREPRSDRGGNRERSNDRGERRPRFERPERIQETSDHGDDILADQMRFAKQQLHVEESHEQVAGRKAAAPTAQPLKKDQKYQPFFVLEDEESK